MCLYLEAASQLSSTQAELRRFPEERRGKTKLLTLNNNNNNNNTVVLFLESNIVQTNRFLYLVGSFQEWYVTLRSQFIFNFIPVSVLILEQYPGKK